jgi:FAD/FMN-containing dehydrogenase
MCIFYRLFRFKNFDDVLDAIADDVEHKHPVEEDTIWGGGSGHKKTVRPKTFHQRDVKLDPVPIFFPKTKEELKEVILKNKRFRAIGSGHSFRGVVETDGVLISVEDMNKVLSIDGTTVTVQAGIKIRNAIRILEKGGLALKNMGNYDRQSLGGAICGGTHGTSGQGKTDTFTSSILSLKMINAKGEDCVLTPEQSVNFGLGGIIYEVTMSLEPFYYLEQNSYNVDPSTIDFNKWWQSGAQFIVSSFFI